MSDDSTPPAAAENANFRGALYIIAGAFLLTVMASLAKYLGDSLPVPMMVFVRFLAGFLFLHVGLMAPLSAVAFALDGILIGAGDQRFMARAMTASALLATAAMAAGRLADLGIGWLWAAIWVFVAGRSVILGARFRGNHWVVLGAD